jgi:hypothetical protein
MVVSPRGASFLYQFFSPCEMPFGRTRVGHTDELLSVYVNVYYPVLKKLYLIN